MRDPVSSKNGSFPWFFDNFFEISLALFFEMRTMTLNMGDTIKQLVKLNEPSRVGD